MGSAKEFYDNFVSYQINSGLNDRIYNLYKRAKKTNIKPDMSILEIGCGIGVLTYFMSKEVKKGNYEATDLSAKSVEFARENLKNSDIAFKDSDILEFAPSRKPFDRILLFDVIEHIPVEKHPALFQKISEWLKEDGLLLINIPNPDYIVYLEKHNPDVLQEIDQPIYTDKLSCIFAESGLNIKYLEKHSISKVDDYVFMIVEKEQKFTDTPVHQNYSSVKKIHSKINRIIRKLRYRFPKH